MGKAKIKNLAQKVTSLFASGLAFTVSCSDGIKTKSKFPEKGEEGYYTKLPWKELAEVILVHKYFPSKLEEPVQRLRTYWQEKLKEEGFIPAEGLWRRNPEGLGAIALYVGGENIFEGAAKRIYDTQGNLYYALPDQNYKGFLTEEEYQRKEREKIEQGISTIRSVWLNELKEKSLATNEMVETIPEDLRWIQQKIGINGVLDGYDGIVARQDKTGKTYYGLSN